MNIVVGITSRPESQEALQRAIDEASLRDGNLILVMSMGQLLGEGISQVRAWKGAVAEERRKGAKLVERLAQRGIRATYRVAPVAATPAEAILGIAAEVGADLIVIGIRRRSLVGKLVLGSVSQGVLLGADCPVLAVKSHFGS